MIAFELSKCKEYGLWVSSTHSTTRLQQATIVFCFLEVHVAPSNKQNHMQTIDQAWLEPVQLLKNRIKAFPSCSLKLPRTLRNGSFHQEVVYISQRTLLVTKACLPLLEQLLQMNAQQNLFVSFVGYGSLKSVHFLYYTVCCSSTPKYSGVRYSELFFCIWSILCLLQTILRLNFGTVLHIQRKELSSMLGNKHLEQ